MKSSLIRLVLSWVVGLAFSFAVAWPLALLLEDMLPGGIFATIAQASLVLLVGLWLFVKGLLTGDRAVKPLFEGIVTIAGQQFPWYQAPAGVSWLPPYIADVTEQIDCSVKTIDHTNGARGRNALTRVLSLDLLEMEGSYQVMYRVINPWKRYTITDFETSYDTFCSRTLRWFFANYPGEALPHLKSEISKALAGTLVPGKERHPDPEKEGALTDEIVDWKEEVYEKARRDFGVEITAAHCDDVNLPKNVTDAKAQINVEETQKRSERTQMENVLDLVHLARNGRTIKTVDGDGNETDLVINGLSVSDGELIRLIQSERGKATRIFVEGDAEDFTKGAAVQTSATRNDT